MEKKLYIAKKHNAFRRKSDGSIISRFLIIGESDNIDNYEEVVDRRPMSERRGFLGRMNPHKPSLW